MDMPHPKSTPKPFNTGKSTPPTTLVMSKLEAELAVERARVEAELAMSRASRSQFTAKKIIILVASLAIVGIFVFVLVSMLTGNRFSNTSVDPDNPDPSRVLPTIEGYHCTTEVCSKVADLGGDQILVRDTAYYVYDRDTDKSMKTTIEPTNYRSFTPFVWGDALLLILEQSTGRQGLYSISANRTLTNSYNYTSFDRDIDSTIYEGMEWVEGLYILATLDTEARLIDIRSGEEIVRASTKIFATRDFIIGYESSNERRIYTMAGVRLLVAEAGSTLIIYDHHLAHITSDRSLDLYDLSGTKLSSSDDYYRTLRDQLQTTRQNYADALRAMSDAFVIPG